MCVRVCGKGRERERVQEKKRDREREMKVKANGSTTEEEKRDTGSATDGAQKSRHKERGCRRAGA